MASSSSTKNKKASVTTTGLGIDYAGVKKIQDAIDAYMKELKSSSGKLSATETQVLSAIKGTQAVAQVSTSIGSCNTAIATAVNRLAAYKTAISDIYAKYKQEDAALANNMNTATSTNAISKS